MHIFDENGGDDSATNRESHSADFVRLSVNINQETANALRSLAAERDISITEAVRRAISLAYFLDAEVRAGRRIMITDRHGRSPRELLFQ